MRPQTFERGPFSFAAVLVKNDYQVLFRLKASK